MISYFKQYLLLSGINMRISASGLVFILLVVFAFRVVSVYSKPAGKRRLKNGQKSRLPPGPRGYPIIGNLLALKEGRRDPDHTFVSMVHMCPSIN